MNSDTDRYLARVTCLAWTTGPRAARSAQAQAIRELVVGARRWAGRQPAIAWIKRTSSTRPVETTGLSLEP